MEKRRRIFKGRRQPGFYPNKRVSVSSLSYNFLEKDDLLLGMLTFHPQNGDTLCC